MKLSICIPTYNRAKQLPNCLNSICKNEGLNNLQFQVCISDNNSTDDTRRIIDEYSQLIPIKYSKNKSNIGVAKNVIRAVEMADGEFAWLIGDDDLFYPNAIKVMLGLIENKPNIDFFYINSSHLTTKYVQSFPQPFDLVNLPDNLEPFSKWNEEGEHKFLELVHPKVSFDFLGGMFLAVFRRDLWVNYVKFLNQKALNGKEVFSTFENTFVHVKIFANAFNNSQAFFYSKPLSICLTGAREWSPKYSLVRSVRLIEALEEYRKNGLPFLKYINCRNYALSYFFQDLVYMYLDKNDRGWHYINPHKLVLKNMFYPNMYLSVIYAVFRKIRNYVKLRNKNE